MSEKFEKCEALNLDINVRHEKPGPGKWDYYVLAADVEKLLSEGIEVFGGRAGADFWSQSPQISDNHTGLLINIRPIEPKDTAESLLKEIVSKTECKNWNPGDWFGLVNRAKRLTGGGK